MGISNKTYSSLKHAAFIILFAALFSLSLIQGMPIVFGTIIGILSIVGIIVVTFSWINDIKNKKPNKNNVFKAQSLIAPSVVIFIIIVGYLVLSSYYPTLPYSYSFLVNDIATHQYKENKSFMYAGLDTTVDASITSVSPVLDDCDARVKQLQSTTWATQGFIEVAQQDCINNNTAKLKELEKSDRIDVSIIYVNKSDRLIKIPPAELYLVDNEGNKYQTCNNDCRSVKEDLLPQSKVTNKYIFKSLPKDKKYKAVLKVPGHATQIISFDK